MLAVPCLSTANIPALDGLQVMLVYAPVDVDGEKALEYVGKWVSRSVGVSCTARHSLAMQADDPIVAASF